MASPWVWEKSLSNGSPLYYVELPMWHTNNITVGDKYGQQTYDKQII